jgi:predicted GIY-YIG superfamily endonuclease
MGGSLEGCEALSRGNPLIYWSPMFECQPTIYIMTNKYHGTIYTGVTSNLAKRVYEHKVAKLDGFTKRYGCHCLA